MASINNILARAAALRDETALNSISPERAGGIMYDTLIALNELWLSQGAALVISKIYASVAAMQADTSPVSDLTGLPLHAGQIVCIASSDSDNGSVYRYNGTSSPRWSEVGTVGEVSPVDDLNSDSTTRPLAAHQGKVLDGKITQLGQEVGLLKFTDMVDVGDIVIEQGSIGASGENYSGTTRLRVKDAIPTSVGEIAVPDGFFIQAIFYYSAWTDSSNYTYDTFVSVVSQSAKLDTSKNYARPIFRNAANNDIVPIDLINSLYLVSPKIDILGQEVDVVGQEVWGKFSYKNLENTFTRPCYLPLSRTIKAGTPCKVTIDLSAWNVYTNIVAYTIYEGANETIKGATYTFKGVVEFTPTIDVNYIRIDSSLPGAGASGSILIRSAVNYTDRIDFDAFVKQMDDIIYIGQPIEVSGIPGYTAIGSSLLAGHKYRIDYAIHNYGHQFYYAELYSNPIGGVFVGSIVSGSSLSNIEGTAEITLTRNAQSIRIGVGSGTIPTDAQATFTIREVFQFADKIYVDGKVAEVESQLSSGYAVLADFFDTEMQNTINSVNALTNQRCLVMPIVTDTHWRWTTETGNNVKKRSINNVRYFCERVYANGVSHLGDILDTEVIGTTTDDELYDLMQQYLMSLASSNRHFYAANGNHDGARLNIFNEMKWYGIIGRATANEPDVKRYQTTPYFYIDHAPTKVRCIFLSNPDNVTGDTTYWGFSQRELDWLSNDALDVPDGYSVLFFTHIPPVSGYADSAANLSSFATLCTNFNATHTGKVLGVICGHEHIDLVIPVGWTYTGGFSNTLPCPIIILGANYYNLSTTDREGEWGGIIYGRNVGTATEDLWTILVYTPDDVNHKLHFIRFGAGADVDV